MTLEQLIQELKIRFNTSPKLYEKLDYSLLVRILKELNQIQLNSVSETTLAELNSTIAQLQATVTALQATVDELQTPTLPEHTTPFMDSAVQTCLVFADNFVYSGTDLTLTGYAAYDAASKTLTLN